MQDFLQLIRTVGFQPCQQCIPSNRLTTSIFQDKGFECCRKFGDWVAFIKDIQYTLGKGLACLVAFRLLQGGSEIFGKPRIGERSKG